MANCLFCKIIQKEIPSKSAFEDDLFYAFHDMNPQAPTHLLLIPKKHVGGVAELTASDEKMAGGLVLRAKELAQSLGLKSYRLVINSGLEAGQSVFHLHLHLLSGRRLRWPPG